MEWLTAELITQLGSSVGVFALSVYFIKTFVAYQKETIGSLIEEMKEERRQNKDLQERELNEFKEAVQKIDNRLLFIEKILERDKQ